MTQTPIRVASTDNLDRSITLVFPGGKRVEYFVGDRYFSLSRQVKSWVADGWHNHIVAQLTKAATAILVEGKREDSLPPWAREQLPTETTMSGNYRTVPDGEYRFTAIVPTTKSLSYNGQRRWYKSKEEALEFCGEVFESEKNFNKPNFDLAIVECVDVVRPKPRVEMISTWASVAKITSDATKA